MGQWASYGMRATLILGFGLTFSVWVFAGSYFLNRIGDLEQRTADGFATADQRISELKREVTEGLSRVERKLDQFIESQSRSKVTTRRARPSKRRR